MLISIKHKFIFICNSKTASTSIERALEPYADIRHGGHPGRKHISWIDTRKEFSSVLEQHPPDTFLKFAVMREPIDWILSWYRYRTSRKGGLLSRRLTFEEFWRRESKSWMAWSRNGEKNLQKKRFVDANGELALDRLLVFENLAEEFAALVRTLDLGANVDLSKVNVSRRPQSDVSLSDDLVAELTQFYEEDYALYHSLPGATRRGG